MVDEDREKISKSKQGQGAYTKPQTAEAYIKAHGADVIRLWVASQDYRSDIVVSEERLKKVSETYRGIRNALRYQLSNLYDFHPSHNAVADKDLTGLDRWILNEFTKLERDVLAAYDKYEFHVVYQRISQFVSVELSSQYHDLVKDRLYTDPANSPRRRSTQTALCHLVTGLARLLAPILAFTADEAWEFVPGVGHPSVHEETHQNSKSGLRFDQEETWKVFLSFRELALPQLEELRRTKVIGKSLDAKVVWHCQAELQEWAKSTDTTETIRELLNVSQLVMVPPNSDNPLFPLRIILNEDGSPSMATTDPGHGLGVIVTHADGVKCERCWHWETDVGQNPEHPTICARCVEAVKQVVPA
jgi:isoleucyl-tRNA synthetase